MFKCKYCGKECKNLNSLRQHEVRCKQNPNRIDLSYIKPGHSAGHKGTNQFIKSKELGLPKPIITDDTKQKLSKVWKGRKHSEETKQKLSKSMKLAVEKYPNSYNASNVNGRVKHYNINGFRIDGKWELYVAEFLTLLNIDWVKPTSGFKYEWDNSIHLYYPDFYLPKHNLYIEVKGYERDKDLAKYKSVNNLIVLKKKEICEIKKMLDKT